MWAKQEKKWSFYVMHSPRILWHLRRFWSQLEMDTGWTSLETHTGYLLSMIYIIYHNWTNNILMRINSPQLLCFIFFQRPAFLTSKQTRFTFYPFDLLYFLNGPMASSCIEVCPSRSLGAKLMQCHCRVTLAIHLLNLKTLERYAINAKKCCWKPTDV